MLNGAIHIHSTLSDGEFTLAELRDVFLAAGCSFACVTDHAEYFDEQKLRAYDEQCAALSDSRFCLVPGLEYSCRDKMHILGYGMTAEVGTREPEEVFRGIEAAGGISVIAHPRTEAFPRIEGFQVLPAGIEAWNSKYDGRYAPRPGTFRLLAALQQRKPEMRAFYGLDLHWKKQYRGLLTLVNAPVERAAILAALRRGDFHANKDGLELPSDGRVADDVLDKFAQQHERCDLLRTCIKKAKKAADRLGLAVPERIKAELRRLF